LLAIVCYRYAIPAELPGHYPQAALRLHAVMKIKPFGLRERM
jgi:hypothetical protein